MKRTLINLDQEDKTWLDREAKARQVPMTALVREAVHNYRVREQSRGMDRLQQVLRDTSGLSHAGDGLAQQRRLREEWVRDDRG